MNDDDRMPWRARAMNEAIKRGEWESVRELAAAADAKDASRVRELCERILRPRLEVAP